MSSRDVLSVQTPDTSYEVVIGRDVMTEAGSTLKDLLDPRRVALVTDPNVVSIYGERIHSSLRDADLEVTEIVVPAGERSKSWETAGSVLERIAEAGLDRGDAVVALGGGVVGDLAGFCASTYMRGVACLQVPTTLLAQVDSSIGGKTGVDLISGKNLAGTFWQPVAVLSDTTSLATLDNEEWANGLTEIAKTAFLLGGRELEWVERSARSLRDREPESVTEAVRLSAAFKASVVSKDEREAGGRECLNLGHTLGHAIERVEGYTGLSHGAAVALGLRFAATLAERITDAEAGWKERQTELMDALGITPERRRYGVGDLLDAMHSDKKARAGVVRFVLSEGPGRWRTVPIEDDVLADGLEAWMNGNTEV